MTVSQNDLANQTHQRRRILYIQKPSGGGSTISLYDLVKGLDRAQYEPIILFLTNNKYRQDFNHLGIKVLAMDFSKQLESKRHRKNFFIANIYHSWRADLPLALSVVRIIKKEKIDLVHQNLGFERAVMIATLLTRTPQICHFRHFIHKIPLTIKALLSSVNAALYTTKAIASQYRSLGLSVAKSSVVYEPIDIKKFSEAHNTALIRQQFAIGDNESIVSNIGRITSWKGQHYFLEAMADIIAQYPNTKVLIVGEPGQSSKDKKYFDELQELAQKTPLFGQVIFTGNRNDVAEIMAASDIVVHSASKPEPFGLVIAEAMAAGVPVIATRGGGTTEIIEDNVTGLLVPMESASGIKEAIEKLFASRELREAISAKAHSEVTRRFSAEQHVAKVQKMYQDVFAESLKADR